MDISPDIRRFRRLAAADDLRADCTTLRVKPAKLGGYPRVRAWTQFYCLWEQRRTPGWLASSHAARIDFSLRTPVQSTIHEFQSGWFAKRGISPCTSIHGKASRRKISRPGFARVGSSNVPTFRIIIPGRVPGSSAIDEPHS